MSIVYTQSLNYSKGGARRNQEMESNIQQHCHQQNNSGLLRYRSAPSSLLTSLMDTNNGCFINEEEGNQTMLTNLERLNDDFRGKPMKEEEETGDSVSKGLLLLQNNHNNNNGCYNSYDDAANPHQIIYQQTQQIQGLPNASLGNAFDGSYNGVSSNLIRQKSSPAGFSSNYSFGNGLAALRDVGSYTGSDISNGQVATTSNSGLHGTLNFSSRPSSSCSNRMPQIGENQHQASFVENGNMGNDNGTIKSYIPNFTSDFWDGSAAYIASKTASNNSEIMFSTSNALETQDADFGYQKLGLSHHLSLPSSSTKISAMDKFLQIQGSVPCKIRAKRGFATHPRSIAERERRIRISARIKKLQDLFPKSDKPTSTSDMLDLAVEYIKDLRKQVKLLTETRAKCRCTSTSS